MAAITVLKCPTCGQTHSLFVVSDDSFVAGEAYEYLCPTRRKLARFVADKAIASMRVDQRARGTLLVTKASKR